MGNFHAVGLKVDGTVVVAGDKTNQEGWYVSSWKDIIAVSAGAGNHTVGLKEDGTVVATGEEFDESLNIENWSDIIALDGSAEFITVGLKSDGTVLATGRGIKGTDPTGYLGLMDVSDWKDIVSIDADGSHILGLKKDGTMAVVKADDTELEVCDVFSWKNIKLPKANKD